MDWTGLDMARYHHPARQLQLQLQLPQRRRRRRTHCQLQIRQLHTTPTQSHRSGTSTFVYPQNTKHRTTYSCTQTGKPQLTTPAQFVRELHDSPKKNEATHMYNIIHIYRRPATNALEFFHNLQLAIDRQDLDTPKRAPASHITHHTSHITHDPPRRPPHQYTQPLTHGHATTTSTTPPLEATYLPPPLPPLLPGITQVQLVHQYTPAAA